jgi:hypothetical protein
MTVIIYHLGAVPCSDTDNCEKPCFVRSEDYLELKAQINRARALLWHDDVTKRLGARLNQRVLSFMMETEDCPECLDYDRIHGPHCKLHPDHDGAPKE